VRRRVCSSAKWTNFWYEKPAPRPPLISAPRWYVGDAGASRGRWHYGREPEEWGGGGGGGRARPAHLGADGDEHRGAGPAAGEHDLALFPSLVSRLLSPD
jgi:hypothetical protein